MIVIWLQQLKGENPQCVLTCFIIWFYCNTTEHFQFIFVFLNKSRCFQCTTKATFLKLIFAYKCMWWWWWWWWCWVGGLMWFSPILTLYPPNNHSTCITTSAFYVSPGCFYYYQYFGSQQLPLIIIVAIKLKHYDG